MKIIMKIVSGILVGACAVSFALAGCGGGGDGANTAQSFTLPAKQITIAEIGDSTTLGTQRLQGVGGPVTFTQNNVPVEVQIGLRSQFNNQANTINYGTGGATLDSVLAGTAPNTRSLANILSNDNSQIVVMNYGINDANVDSLSTFQANLASALSLIRGSGKTMVLEEPNPLCSPTPDTQINNIPAFVSAIESFGAANGVAVVKQYSLIQSAHPDYCTYLPDGMHPNDAMYLIKAQNEIATLIPIVQGLLQ